VRAVKEWHRLPREAVESLSVEIFRTQPDTALSDLLWGTQLEHGDCAGDSGVLPSPSDLVSL